MYAVENKQNNEISALHAELELKYGPAVAQGLIDDLNRRAQPQNRAPQYMDVKALSELQERFRAQAMVAVWRLREWRRAGMAQDFQQNLIQLEGAMLRRQCEDAFRLYRQATNSYFALHRAAMAHFTGITAGFDFQQARTA